MQNGICEAFNGRMRDELLNETLFFGLDHARSTVARWVADYNDTRPHSALGYQAPAIYAAQFTAMGDRLRTPDPLRRSPIEALFSGWSLDASPLYVMFDLVTRLASPYDLNPLNLNPLKDLVTELVDFDRVRKSKLKVYVSATNVETGRAQVWDKKHLAADHVMASACLPWIFQAVEVDGVPYWDGGFTANPALWPLFENCASDDVVLVQINPVHRPGAPRTARDIINRVNEITFNASLLRDLRSVDFVARLIEAGRLEGTGYRRMLMHAIADEKALSELGASSKLNVEPAFIDMLFARGRDAAENWLLSSIRHLGVRSTINIRKLFQGEDDTLDGGQLKPPRKPPRTTE